MKFRKTHDINELTAETPGCIVIGGWIEDLRKMGKLTFLTVRDVTGLAQIIVKDDKILPEDLTRQTVVRHGRGHHSRHKGARFQV
jgi:aspartyl-tRNA synthetase